MSRSRLTQSEIEQAKACDLLALAERCTPLWRVAASGGGEYAGPCPVPGCTSDHDGFRVQPERHRWLCRQCTGGKWQDAIELQMRLTGQEFPEAVRILAEDALQVVPGLRPTPRAMPSTGQPPATWQARAQAVAAQAAGTLWQPCGEVARTWLRARGLADATLERWQIGYIPENRHESAARWGLAGGPPIYLPRGILIPGHLADAVWYLKIRRPEGKPKYTQVRGGYSTLYMAAALAGATLTCVAEGELDCLLLWQCLQHAADPRWHHVAVVTLGSQSGRLDIERWAGPLGCIESILVLYDQDGKSEGGMRYWAGLTPRAHVVHWPNLRPGDKDLTDYHLAGGDLVALVASAASENAARPHTSTELSESGFCLCGHAREDHWGLYHSGYCQDDDGCTCREYWDAQEE